LVSEPAAEAVRQRHVYRIDVHILARVFARALKPEVSQRLINLFAVIPVAFETKIFDDCRYYCGRLALLCGRRRHWRSLGKRHQQDGVFGGGTDVLADSAARTTIVNNSRLPVVYGDRAGNRALLGTDRAKTSLPSQTGERFNPRRRHPHW